MNETSTLDPSVIEYLRSHQAGVLATTNRSGTPQQTLIGYRYDGNDIAISTRASTLKAKNISKRPGISLAIIDGRSQLIVHGEAKMVRDPEKVLSLHLERGLLGSRQSEADFPEVLRREERVVLLIRPEKAYPERVNSNR